MIIENVRVRTDSFLLVVRPIAKTTVTMRITASPKPKAGKMVSTTWIINQDATTYAAATRKTFRRFSSSKNYPICFADTLPFQTKTRAGFLMSSIFVILLTQPPFAPRIFKKRG